MVKVFLGNCLINDAVNRVLISDSHHFKRIMVFSLIVFSLFLFGLITIFRHLNPVTWFSLSGKEVRKIRAAH
jgi:hypothetical protein